jgi:RND family efflux transporter MFP subunit
MAKAQLLEAGAKVDQAEADLLAAKANVEVDEANLEKAKVLAEYTKITSPYDGVITSRAFHVGDFIRSASDGANPPLLRVARTELMRIITKVPDPDVPFLDKGDAAVFRVKTLGNVEFKGQISRLSYAEDEDTRTMRVEVDLPNTDGRLRAGMYGLLTILLEPRSTNPNTVTIPSSCLVGEAKEGQGSVYVIRDGKAYLTPVKLGADDGVQVEVLSGLKSTDLVAMQNTDLRDGMEVVAEEPKPHE